ncbi:MAG: glutathione S-transferase family protein [Gammaproteobacteria bacterium]|nr:glutathione S-transferase family protein [Gammaproteobacteria bacterium]
MITLYQFPPAWGLPNASPFCMKVETYLRMCNLPYTTVNVLNPAKGPKGKLPYITDGSNIVADSGLILDYLKKTYGDALDARLGTVERAQALAWQRLLEEHLYWCAVYDRWAVDKNWTLTKPAFFGSLPPGVRDLVAVLARRNQLKALHGHGVGRHTSGEIYALGCADLTALSDFLADKPFFLGAEPTALDATAYAFLANLLWVPIDSPLTRHARSFANFIAYVKRMKQRYYA